jgi:organic radical activating enzyme
MYLGTLSKIITDYSNSGGKIIHFTGGEPSVYPHIELATRFAKWKGLVVSTNTNGFKRFNVRAVNKLKASFDTPYKEKFNKTMGYDCFDKVVDNLKYYSNEMIGKMLSITAVLNKQTYPDMLELAKFVHENFKVHNLYYSNYKGCNTKFAFSQEEIDDMFENHIPKVLEYFKSVGAEYSYKQLSLYKPDDFRNIEERFPENKIVPCYIQLSEMTVDVNGNCYNCSHLYRDGVKPIKSYNVSDMSLQECFKSLKNDLTSYCHLSNKCLNGCNTNLIGFNRAVATGEHILTK